MRATLALLTRSLRDDALRLRAHLARFFLLFPCLFCLNLASNFDQVFGAPGRYFFYPMAFLNFALISLAGIGYFSSAITEEKEEMTLGLLRMAGVGPLSLLLGKGAMRLITAALILSVQFPFTFLAVTLGGITQNQVIAAYLTLMSYMLLVSSIALFFSVACRRTGRAAFNTTVLIALLLFGPTLLSGIWLLLSGTMAPNSYLHGWAPTVLTWLSDASAFNRLTVVLSSGFMGSPLSLQVIVHTVAAVLIFGVAWLTFDYFTREQVTAGPKRSFTIANVFSKRRRRIGMSRTWRHAIAWKDFYFLAGGRWMSVVKFLTYLAVCGGLLGISKALNPHSTLRLEEVAGLLVMVSFVGFCLEASLLAARLYREETRWNTLSTLMMLPITVPQIAYQKLGGCLLGLLPATAAFGLGILCRPQIGGELAKDIITEPWQWVWIVHLILFWHVVAFVSLKVKWGALPLTIGIFLVGYFMVSIGTSIFFAMTIGIGGPSGAGAEAFFRYLVPIAIVFAHLIAAAGLQRAIGRQLQIQAANTP